METYNTIKVIRGDSLSFLYTIYDSQCDICGEPYELKDNDALFFGITLPHGRFEDALIKKTYRKENLVNNKIRVYLSSDETSQITPGIYYYEFKLAKNLGMIDEEVITTTRKTKFIILN